MVDIGRSRSWGRETGLGASAAGTAHQSAAASGLVRCGAVAALSTYLTTGLALIRVICITVCLFSLFRLLLLSSCVLCRVGGSLGLTAYTWRCGLRPHHTAHTSTVSLRILLVFQLQRNWQCYSARAASCVLCLLQRPTPFIIDCFQCFLCDVGRMSF